MRKSIVLLSYAGAVSVGVAVGVLSTKVYFERTYRDLADAEIESVKRVFRKLDNDIGEDFEDIGSDSVVIREDGVPVIDIPVPSYYEYSTVVDNRAELEHPSEDDSRTPYFIDIDMYDEATIGFAKKQFLYYMEDETLLDAENEELVSAFDTVGCENLDRFDGSFDSCCYIRNECLKEDYEVSKIFGSYGSITDED